MGVFVPLIEALTERKWGDNSAPKEVSVKNVALFATPATVSSRAFQRELAFRAIGVDVEAQACGGLVDAGIKVVGAKGTLHQLLGDVVVLCMELSRAIHGDAIGITPLLHAQTNLVGDSIKGVVPTDRFKVVGKIRAK